MDIVIVSSEIKAEARKEIKDHKTGEISYGQDPLKKLYIKTWADVLNVNNAALSKMKELLNSNLDKEDGLNYLQKKYSHVFNKK